MQLNKENLRKLDNDLSNQCFNKLGELGKICSDYRYDIERDEVPFHVEAFNEEHKILKVGTKAYRRQYSFYFDLVKDTKVDKRKKEYRSIIMEKY